MTFLKIFVFTTILTLTFATNSRSNNQFMNFAGPFRLVIKRIEKCPPGLGGPSVIGQYDIRTRYLHYSRTIIVNGNVSIPFQVDDTLSVKANIASWSNNGGWKPNAYILKNMTAMCTLIKRHFQPMWEYVSTAYIGEVFFCPFPAGLYRAVDLPYPERLYAENSMIREFVYGRWRIDFQTFDRFAKVVLCGRVFLDTLPR